MPEDHCLFLVSSSFAVHQFTFGVKILNSNSEELTHKTFESIKIRDESEISAQLDVFPKEMLLLIAENLPHSSAGLLSLCSKKLFALISPEHLAFINEGKLQEHRKSPSRFNIPNCLWIVWLASFSLLTRVVYMYQKNQC